MQVLTPPRSDHSISATPTQAQPESQSPKDDARRILSGASDLLAQADALLGSLAPSDYTNPVPAAFNATIGGHLRHCLDHFLSLLNGFDSGLIDYDRRNRDPRIERDLDYARSLVRTLRSDLDQLDVELLDAPIQTRCEVSYRQGNSPISQSSLGRELVYAIAHGIHHFALIAIMARLQGIRIAEGFGMAPSTLAHLRTQACTGEGSR